MQPLCEIKNLCKDYPLPHDQALHVLKEINLSIYKEEIVAIIGPSGCGKSTLLRILSGLETKTSGEIFYKGTPHTGLLPDTSMVFQSFALYPWMTVKENIALVLKALYLTKEEIEQKTQGVLIKVGLTGFEDAYPKEISGGMKQRVGLARALVRNPTLLLMDEPFSALDAFTAEGLRSEIINIWKQRDKNLSSIILISHEIQEVVYMADRIIVLGANPGRILLILENKLPRPRDYRSPAFLDLVDLIHNTYYKPQEPTPSTKALIAPLLPVTHDEITGLLQYINREKGPSDLYKIGKEVRLPFDRLILIAEASELLHFIEITHQTALLTEIGQAYLHASFQERRVLWKKQLLTIPLFIKTIEWIKNSPGHALPKKELLQKLATELPQENAEMQLKTLFRWGRYGDLFKLDKKTHSLSFY